MPRGACASAIFCVAAGVFTQSAFAVTAAIVAHTILVSLVQHFAKSFALAQLTVGTIPSVFAGTEDSILVCWSLRVIFATRLPGAGAMLVTLVTRRA